MLFEVLFLGLKTNVLIISDFLKLVDFIICERVGKCSLLSHSERLVFLQYVSKNEDVLTLCKLRDVWHSRFFMQRYAWKLKKFCIFAA